MDEKLLMISRESVCIKFDFGYGTESFKFFEVDFKNNDCKKITDLGDTLVFVNFFLYLDTNMIPP